MKTKTSEQIISNLKKKANEFTRKNLHAPSELDYLIIQNAFLTAASVALVDMVRDKQ